MKEVALEFRDVCLFSSEAVSIQDFTLTVYKGEYLVIQGADGSGKRLLIRSLHGEMPIYKGEIYLNGERYFPRNIQQAHQKRVFCVSAGSNLIDTQSIADNLFTNLGGLKPFRLINNRLMINEANAILGKYGLNIDTRRTPAGMPPSVKCIIEMIKWHIHGAKVIILDNVLAIAGLHEYETFMHIVQTLCREGVTILHLKNRCIPEFAFASRCILLSRHGRIARIVSPGEFSAEEINAYLRHMPCEQVLMPDPPQNKRELLRVEHLSSGRFSDLNFCLYAGEALGLLCDTGEVYGSLADVLSGTCPYTGQIYVAGKHERIRNENEAIRLGIGVLLSDTRNMYFPDLSAQENVVLPFLERAADKFGILKRRKMQALEKDISCSLEDLRKQFVPGKSEEYMLSLLSRYILYPYRVLVLPFPSAVNDAHKENMIKYLAACIRTKGSGLIIIATRQERLQSLGCRIIDLRDRKT